MRASSLSCLSLTLSARPRRATPFKREKVLLWSQTSRTIPVADIEHIVYHVDADYLLSLREQPRLSSAHDLRARCDKWRDYGIAQ